MPILDGNQYDLLRADACDRFFDGFRRCNSGSLRREYDGMVLTLFHRWGSWRWVTDYRGVAQFSKRGYRTAEDAAYALWDLVGGW